MTNHLAQTINNPALGSLGSLSATQFLGRLIPALISLGLVIGGVIFIFMLIIGGIEWISSGGDKMRYESARKRITNALVGLVVRFSFLAIINLVECFFGIGLRQVQIGEFSIGFSSTLICGGIGGSTPDPCGGLPPIN